MHHLNNNINIWLSFSAQLQGNNVSINALCFPRSNYEQIQWLLLPHHRQDEGNMAVQSFLPGSPIYGILNSKVLNCTKSKQKSNSLLAAVVNRLKCLHMDLWNQHLILFQCSVKAILGLWQHSRGKTHLISPKLCGYIAPTQGFWDLCHGKPVVEFHL